MMKIMLYREQTLYKFRFEVLRWATSPSDPTENRHQRLPDGRRSSLQRRAQRNHGLCSRTLTDHFDFVAVCPEVAIGLGIPREPIRLVGDPQHPEALGSVHAELNVTRPLTEYGQTMARQLSDICGYIFMQKSPSCGLERVKVYHANGAPVKGGGRGVYAQAFCALHPDLPVEEDGRLNDPVLRENFLTRVFAYSAWQQLLQKGLTRRDLTEFHSRYKYLLMAHNPVQYKALGNLLGNMGQSDPRRARPALLQ